MSKGNPNWVQGISGNPKGRPRKNYFKEDLWDAIKTVEKKRGPKQLKLLEYFVQRAFDEDAVLLGLMKKLLPDLKAEELGLYQMEDKPRLVKFSLAPPGGLKNESKDETTDRQSSNKSKPVTKKRKKTGKKRKVRK